MSLFLSTENSNAKRAIIVSDRAVMIMIFLLSYAIAAIAKRTKHQQSKNKKVGLPNSGGDSFSVELYNDNELGYIILFCITDNEKYLIRDLNLTQLIFSLKKNDHL